MDRATDSALKLFARRVCVVIGLVACVTNVGCARMRSFNSGTPLMLGAAAPFGRTRPPVSPGNDLYAQEVGRGVAHSRTLLAQDRAQTKARNRLNSGPAGSELAETPPLQVALHPPEPIKPGVKRSQSEPLPLLGSTEATTPPAEAATPSLSLEPKPALDSADSTELSTIVSASQARLESIASYQVLMKRRERVGETLGPAEEVLLSVRRNPRAIRLEWPDGPSKGREVLYSASDDDKLMHVKMPDSIVPVPPMSLAVDNPMVLRNSRHPITEAGFETILADLQKQIAQAGTIDSPTGQLTYAGLENPGQLDQPSHKIVRVTPTGEHWVVYIDPTSKLPVMVEGVAANGNLLERYLFGTVTIDPEALAVADAFDPSQRWGQSPSGLLSRLARVGGGKASTEAQAH
ncbi:DUF1571 domain-containing protein [Singulisphaera acidiphila]|uniref:Uncharacterized protein n=1 Tax=Singulisphaera acidiphila (strain ATCC BAA-1392 / DSM 18658 / VKM B-2454 / MOB10) TaxID=886293 RepID=L0DLQ3_SINAD|nr:DUF1571 domain-containing protein [Singulisphaera acidiphila]AGA30314.1 Protein of unknown function (DUF1571) [Singulisphaera acidiphila DSM 18658]